VVSRQEELLLFHEQRCLSLLHHLRYLLNTATLHQRAQVDAREASGLFAANDVEVLCVYCCGDGGGGGRGLCTTAEEA
jgi:hypothetical protein